jgi:nucleoside-diphosphate-sugar epimerase
MIIGGAGMIGRKLADRLSADRSLNGHEIDKLTLVDVVPPVAPVGYQGEVNCVTADLTSDEQIRSLVAKRPHVIFHLAAIVSGDAEANFEKGYAINLDGTRQLFEAIRNESKNGPYRPKMVFTSSLAVFGQPLPELIPDDFMLAPLTSYGTQKAVGELLLGDYSRRSFFDGIALRLPTICVRPGKPNKAASGFFSAILREPLLGQEAVLPVASSVRHWFASPRAAVGALVHAATIDLAELGGRRSLNLPGLSATVDDQINALRRVAGERAVKLIRTDADPAVEAIIASWPQGFTAEKALKLGFTAEKSMDDIIRVHIEDDLDGNIAH